MHALKRIEHMPNEIQVLIEPKTKEIPSGGVLLRVWLCLYYKLATQQGKVDDT